MSPLIALMRTRDFARWPWPFVALMVAATAMVLTGREARPMRLNTKRIRLRSGWRMSHSAPPRRRAI